MERETQQFAGFAIVRCNPRFRLRCYAASWPKARLRARPCCRGPRTGSRHRAPVFGERGSSSRADRDQVSGSAPRSARPPQPGSGRYSPGFFTTASSFILPWQLGQARSAKPALGARPRQRSAPGVPPRGDIRSCAPAFRALHSPRSGAKVASPEGRLRADARAPWTRCCEHPGVVDCVEARRGYARPPRGGFALASRHRSESGSMSTATVPCPEGRLRARRRPSSG